MQSTHKLQLHFTPPDVKRRVQIREHPSSQSTSKVIRYLRANDIIEVEGYLIRGYYKLKNNKVSDKKETIYLFSKYFDIGIRE